MISDVPLIQLGAKWAKRDKAERITLVLDIDGTLIEGDSTNKAARKYIKKHFWGSLLNGAKGILALIGLGSLMITLGYIAFNIGLLYFQGFQNEGINLSPIPYAFLIIALVTGLLLFKHTKIFIKLPPQSTRAKYKKELAREITLVEHDIKFIPATLTLIKQERERNRPIFLATGTDQKWAEMIRDALQKELHFTKKDKEIGLVASQGKENLTGNNKAFKLIKIFGRKNFIYVGNSSDDLSVWEHCIHPIIVVKGNSHSTLKSLLKAEKDVQVIYQ